MPKGKNRHLTIDDRLMIEKGLDRKESFASIARSIGVSASTVSREVLRNRHLHIPKGRRFNVCIRKRDCAVAGICGNACTSHPPNAKRSVRVFGTTPPKRKNCLTFTPWAWPSRV